MMSDLIYCVRVIRKDHPKPSEEDYYYLNRADAELHLQMFKDDDPVYAKMYDRIQDVHGLSGNKILIRRIKTAAEYSAAVFMRAAFMAAVRSQAASEERCAGVSRYMLN
jgi:hypothetical protein